LQHYKSANKPKACPLRVCCKIGEPGSWLYEVLTPDCYVIFTNRLKIMQLDESFTGKNQALGVLNTHLTEREFLPPQKTLIL
jgi:hypothetical protein